MPKLWEKTGNAKNNSDLREVDLSTLAITQPTIIFISGLPTHAGDPAESSKDINYVKKILADHPELKSPPTVYAWAHKSVLSALFNIIPYNCFPQRHCTPAARDLAKGAIMPLVSEGGQRLSHDDAKKRLRNLTFFTFSAGTIVVQEVYNASLKMMQDIGYKQEEARELLHEVAAISIATLSVPGKEQNRFSTLSLIHSDDVLVRVKNRVLHPLRNIFSRAGWPFKITPLSDTSAIVTAGAKRKKWDWRKRKEVIEGVRLPRWHFTIRNEGRLWPNFNHEIFEYLNYQDRSSQMSRVVPTALVNAVNRTTTDPVQLLAPLQNAPAQYRKKIAKASLAACQRRR